MAAAAGGENPATPVTTGTAPESSTVPCQRRP